MAEPKKENPFPDPPEGKDLFLKAGIAPVFWWVAAFIMVGVAIIWLPTQCATDGMNLPEAANDSLESLPVADQDKELEFREDGFWYLIESDKPFSGAAVSFHEDGVTMKSRTRIEEGIAIGLIEEWDGNGTSRGPRFKDEFAK